MPDQHEADDQSRWWMSRRAFLSSGALESAAVAIGGATPAKPDGPANDVDAMVLKVAAAAAVFPVSLRSREGVSPRSRLTAQRVARAWKRCSPERAEQARRGAQLLLDHKLGGGDRETLLARLGEIVDRGNDDTIANLAPAGWCRRGACGFGSPSRLPGAGGSPGP